MHYFFLDNATGLKLLEVSLWVKRRKRYVGNVEISFLVKAMKSYSCTVQKLTGILTQEDTEKIKNFTFLKLIYFDSSHLRMVKNHQNKHLKSKETKIGGVNRVLNCEVIIKV